MAKFNYRELTRSVARSETGTKRVNTIMQERFIAAKEGLIQDFDNHPVTQEIQAGVGAVNTSNTLNGEGDLFSFIGFEAGSDPVSPVREVLREQTVLINSRTSTVGTGKVHYKFSIRVPIEAIRKASPMPWEGGNSWVDGVQKGISGFSNYISGIFRSPKPSRSGGGRQAENEVRQATFKKRPYLSEIVAAFVTKFR